MRCAVGSASLHEPGRQVRGRDAPASAHVDAGHGGAVEERRVEPAPIEPDGRLTARFRSVRQAERGAGPCFHAHGGYRANDALEHRSVEPGTTEGGHCGRRREHAARAPDPRPRAFEDDDVVAGTSQTGREHRASNAPADDRYLDRFVADHPCAASGSSAAGSAAVVSAASGASATSDASATGACTAAIA